MLELKVALVSPNLAQNVANSSFYLKRDLSFQIFYVWATFAIKFVIQNYQKSPNLFTLFVA